MASKEKAEIAVVGAGLAGCECALALAGAGVACDLYEQKPLFFSPAHESPDLAELVCSNSFRSNDESSAVGLLKKEMRQLGSACMRAAEQSRVPAGKALAVDRRAFSKIMTETVAAEPLINLVRRQIKSLEDPELAGKTVVVAAGPLASDELAASLAAILGDADRLYFYDAIAPIVSADSVDMSIAFYGSRYANEPPPRYQDDAPLVERQLLPESAEGDYLNCPMNRLEYETFYQALLAAEKVAAHAFEREVHFEACMPVEALAERGERTLTFGPLKPVGFTDPRTGRRPYALLQLRAENLERTAFNLVGCQTKMTYTAQAKVFRLVPGLEKAEFLRFGSMHRNTYVNAPDCLNPNLSLKKSPDIFLAGQITGVEGYVESAACGLWLGKYLAARAKGREICPPPPESALGALLGHLKTPVKNFQPSNVNFGLLPEPTENIKKNERKTHIGQRAEQSFNVWLSGL